MDRTFNPAGVPNPDGKESLLISMYDAKPREQSSYQAPAQPDAIEDEVPF